MKLLIVLACLVYSTTAFMFTGREHLNQNATVLCSRQGDLCTMTVKVLTTDTIAIVYMESPTNETINSVGLFDSTTGDITGTGAEGDPYTFNITVDCLPVVLNGSQDNSLVQVSGDDTLNAAFVMKSLFADSSYAQLEFNDDVRYLPTCNFTGVGDQTLITGEINVVGNNPETIEQLSDTLQLRSVLGDGTDIPSEIFLPGENMFYEIRSLDPNTRAIGYYAYSCYMCDTADCSGISVQIIDASGCAAVGIVGEFNNTGGRYLTQVFPAFGLTARDSFYFRCVAGSCYHDSDDRCPRLCNSKRRRKRQADEEDEEAKTVATRITISVDENIVRTNGETQDISIKPATAAPCSQTTATVENMGLIGAVIGLAALLIIGLVVAVVVFVILTRSRQPEEKA